jgi:hypothetical protein
LCTSSIYIGKELLDDSQEHLDLFLTPNRSSSYSQERFGLELEEDCTFMVENLREETPIFLFLDHFIFTSSLRDFWKRKR